jgi:hypothetical protein
LTSLSGRVSACGAVHLGAVDADPLALETHVGLEVGRRVELVGKDAVGGGRRDHGVLGGDRHGAVLLHRREDLLEVRPVAAVDADDGPRDVGLGAPDVEREDLELALEVHDVVHDLGHHERVDQVPLDAHVFVGWLCHRAGIISQTRPATLERSRADGPP